MFYLEMENEKSIYISGCKEIKKFTEDNISMLMSDVMVSVSGSNLCTTSYSNGEMYISGDILRIEFSAI